LYKTRVESEPGHGAHRSSAWLKKTSPSLLASHIQPPKGRDEAEAEAVAVGESVGSGPVPSPQVYPSGQA
jgi:hypothetical protein